MMAPCWYSGRSSSRNSRPTTSRSPTSWPESLIARASGESSNALMTIGRTGQAPRAADECRVCAFSRPRRATQKNQFLWKPKVGATVLRLKILPDGFKD